ncbi:unnamed protein product [Scomber scombrus]|uniref:Unnamed protein product n=1 Tax=Scomber scombrus TaxID=13677 RepID=A0AAV1NQW9_SCOSC
MKEGENTHLLCHRASAACVSEPDATSQDVDDVGEKDEAHDGEKHQHQNVHHGGNVMSEMDGADARRSRQHTKQQPVQEIGRVRKRSEWRRVSPTLPPPPPAAKQEGKVDA